MNPLEEFMRQLADVGSLDELEPGALEWLEEEAQRVVDGGES